MKLKEQVCSLEFAKRLKELGVGQESLWYWQLHCVNGKYYIHTKEQVDKSTYPLERYYSAFTVAELGGLLINNLSDRRDVFDHIPNWEGKNQGGPCWFFIHSINSKENKAHKLNANTEANARAKMLIYLLESGELKLEEIKL